MANGLLDFISSPAGIGLLSAAAGTMAGARRGQPWNTAGRGAIAGLTGYAQANEDILRKQQLDEAQKMQGLQRQQLEGQLAQQQRGLQREMQIEEAAKSAFRPATPGTPERTAFQTPLFIQEATRQESQPASSMFDAPPYDLSATTTPATPGTPGGFDNKSFLEKYRQIDPIKAMQYEADLKKQGAPTISKAGDIARDSNNNIVFQNPAEPKDKSVFQVRDGRNIVSINPNITEQQASQMGLGYRKGAGAVVGTGEMDRPAVIGGDGGGKTPVYYLDDRPGSPTFGQAIVGNLQDARGKRGANFDFGTQGGLASAKAEGTQVGTGKGESAVKLKGLESDLPGLEKVVTDLSALGKKATYTTIGQAANSARRQAGFSVGDGAIARKEYIAKVDNEVLPLLRSTFGAAFTQKEGEQLKVTLGDPNASPEEKDAVLRAFIQAKRAQIKGMNGAQPSAPAAPKFGDVRGGYAFKGGDPSDQKNWVKR